MSSALVPGRILREAPVSTLKAGDFESRSSNNDTPGPGDVGPIWSSAIGGGEGSRGEEIGDCAEAIVARCELRSSAIS